MKYLFSLLLVIGLANVSYCQLKPIEDDIHRIDLKLEKFRKQHQTGTLMIIIGVAISSIPILVGFESYDAYGFIAGGGILSLSGMIVSIDSYKHLRLESNSGIRKPVRQESEPQSKPKKPKS